MTKQDLKNAIKTITDQLVIGSIETALFDDFELAVQTGVRKELKKQHFTIKTSEDGCLMFGVYAAPKGARAKKVAGPKVPKLRLVQGAEDRAAFEEKSFELNDPDHHDVFPGGKAGVEVVAETATQAAKRAYTKMTDELTTAFRELRHVKLTDGRRVAFGKEIAGKDPIAEQTEWLCKNSSKVGAAAITLRGKANAGKVFLLATDSEALLQVRTMVSTALPGIEIVVAN